jgi:hypothetical protein
MFVRMKNYSHNTKAKKETTNQRTRSKKEIAGPWKPHAEQQKTPILNQHDGT